MTNDAGASKRRWLLVCYLLEVLALAVWTGGLIVIIAVVIPSVFNSFGMEQGGRFLTRVFKGYDRLVAIATIVLVGVGALRFWWGIHGESEAAVARPELLLLTGMIVVASLISLVWGPESVRLQEQAFATLNEAEKKSAYDAFFRMHSVVRGLYVLNLGLGIFLMATKVKRLMR